MKSITIAHLGKTVKLGRKRRAIGTRRVHLSDFVARAKLPPIPASCTFVAKAASVLSDIYVNDELGDCVVAGGYHILAVETGNATGIPFHATRGQIIKDYSAIGGYVPGDASTDQGCNETDAFAYWQKHGFADGSKVLGAISINAVNPHDVMAACYLFENLVFGIELPDAWVNPFPEKNGFMWDVAGAANPDNGHCVVGTGFTPKGVQIDTWGLIGGISWPAVAEYCSGAANGELYALLTAAQLARGQAKAPNGVAWGDLVAAFDSMGGNVPIQAPTPPVPPSPIPSVRTATLAEAQAILAAGWPR